MDAPFASEPPAVVATSIFVSLQSRLSHVHACGKMGAFAGPPGIGKTTAIRCFARSHPSQVAVPLVRREGATQTSVLQAMLAAVRVVNGSDARHAPNDARRVEGYLEQAVKEWKRVAEWHADMDGRPVRLSLVFDEAQSIGPKLIDMLRFWTTGQKTSHLSGSPLSAMTSSGSTALTKAQASSPHQSPAAPAATARRGPTPTGPTRTCGGSRSRGAWRIPAPWTCW